MSAGGAIVTGASGFIGRHLVVALLAQGRPVRALCRRAGDLRHLADPRLEVVEGSLEDAAAHLRAHETVFHLAGARNAPGTSPEALRRTNVDQTLRLARAAADAGVRRFVHVSTSLVFGPSSRAPVTEDAGFWHDPPLYPASKIEAQVGLRHLARGGLDLVTAFPSIVFGPDWPGRRNRVTNELRRLLRTRCALLVGGGDHRRSLAYVSDVVRGLLLLEERGAAGGEYLLGGPDVTARELAAATLRLSGGTSGARLRVPALAARIGGRLLDRARGHHPELGYAEAVRTLQREWRCDSARAAALGYTATPVERALTETLRFLARPDA